MRGRSSHHPLRKRYGDFLVNGRADLRVLINSKFRIPQYLPNVFDVKLQDFWNLRQMGRHLDKGKLSCSDFLLSMARRNWCGWIPVLHLLSCCCLSTFHDADAITTLDAMYLPKLLSHDPYFEDCDERLDNATHPIVSADRESDTSVTASFGWFRSFSPCMWPQIWLALTRIEELAITTRTKLCFL